jgi:TRAP-type C4-dicarboxylate transport system permease small subunit
VTRLDRLDRAIYRGERFFAGALFLLMAVVVFADVVHRVLSRTPGRFSVMLSGVLGRSPEELETSVSPALILLLFFFIAWLAIRTRARPDGTPRPGRGTCVLLAVASTLVLAIAARLFLKLAPEGIVWAPYFGLCCLLWSGLIGASMATYTGQHLTMEMGEKIWPSAALPWIRRLAQLLTGAFTLVIATLGAMSVRAHFEDWSSGPGAGLIPSIDWPKWIVFLVIPYAFVMITLRFWGRMAGLLSPPPAHDAALPIVPPQESR